MAKYVEYTPDVFSQSDGPGVNCWWFPTSFSQSQLGDRIIGSNACTLIAVLLAGKIHEFKIVIWGYPDQPLSRMLVSSLAEAIIDGNEIHETLMQQGTVHSMDLTVPEALRATKFKYPNLIEWGDKTAFVMDPLGDSLTETLLPVISDFEHNPPEGKRPNSDLYAVLVADGRTVLFVCQSDTGKVTMIDSHAHTRCLAGAVIAQARIGDLEQLCSWFCLMLNQAFERGSRVQPYEVAFLYVKDQSESESSESNNNNTPKK